MALPTITVVGNLTADPELRFTQAGVAVASFSVACTDRKFDKESSKYVDGETTFMRVSAWRDLGSNVAETLHKGTQVIVTGKLKSNVVEKDGAKTTYFEVDADAVGPSLQFATAVVTRTAKNGGGQGNDQAQAYQPAQGYQPPQQNSQPAPQQPAQPAASGGYNAGYGDF